MCGTVTDELSEILYRKRRYFHKCKELVKERYKRVPKSNLSDEDLLWSLILKSVKRMKGRKAGIMKNVLVAIILCIIGGLSVAGCNSNESKPIKTDMTDESLQVAESEPAEKEDEDEEKSPEKK